MSPSPQHSPQRSTPLNQDSGHAGKSMTARRPYVGGVAQRQPTVGGSQPASTFASLPVVQRAGSEEEDKSLLPSSQHQKNAKTSLSLLKTMAKLAHLSKAAKGFSVMGGSVQALGIVGQTYGFGKDVRNGKFKNSHPAGEKWHHKIRKGAAARSAGRGFQNVLGMTQFGVNVKSHMAANAMAKAKATYTAAKKATHPSPTKANLDSLKHASKHATSHAHTLSNVAGGLSIAAGSLDLLRGGWNLNLARKRSNRLRKAEEEGKLTGVNADTLTHIQELHSNKKKKSGFDMGLGALGITGGALALNPATAPLGIALGIGVGVGKLGWEGFKAYRQHKRDQADRRNDRKDFDEDQLYDAKKGDAEAAIQAGKDASYWPSQWGTIIEGRWNRHKLNKWENIKRHNDDAHYFNDETAKRQATIDSAASAKWEKGNRFGYLSSKFSGWWAGRKKAALEKENTYFSDKLAAYKKKSEPYENGTQRFYTPNINKTTKKKEDRLNTTVEDILAHKDKTDLVRNIGLRDTLDNADLEDNDRREMIKKALEKQAG